MTSHGGPDRPAPRLQNKQAADNLKRLKAIQENLKLKQAQATLTLTALKNVDSQNCGHRIVFNDDTSDDDDVVDPVKDHKETSTDTKKLTLFDSDDEDDDDDIEDVFKSKPHLEGKKGEKLMRLEQKFGDARFKLDARFALSDSEDDGGEDYEDRNTPSADIDRSLEEEKLASLKVLENIVGKTTLARFSEKLKKNVKHITDMNQLRFDPNKMHKSEAESKKEPSEGNRTVTHKKLLGTKTNDVEKVVENKKAADGIKSPSDIKKTARNVTDGITSPSDIKKTAGNVTSSLFNLFKDNDTGSFSLLKVLDQKQDDDDDEMESGDNNDMEDAGVKPAGQLSALFQNQSGRADLEHVNMTISKSILSKEMDTSGDSSDDMRSDDELADKDTRLQVPVDGDDSISEDLINAGKVDIRYTKEQWLERWTEIRPVLVTLYKRKHKEAMKNKRKHEEFTRKKEFINRSRKNRFRKHFGK